MAKDWRFRYNGVRFYCSKPTMGATSLHFTEAELRCKGTDCNVVPPLQPLRGCGQNLCSQTLVDGLEKFRAKCLTRWLTKNPGRFASAFPGVAVIDASRCLKHNVGTTGAAADSQHPNGRAADVRVPGLTAAELEAIAETIPVFKGIGRDDLRDMIHLDVRPTVVVARWCYHRVAGKIVWGAWYPAPAEMPGQPISV